MEVWESGGGGEVDGLPIPIQSVHLRDRRTTAVLRGKEEVLKTKGIITDSGAQGMPSFYLALSECLSPT